MLARTTIFQLSARGVHLIRQLSTKTPTRPIPLDVHPEVQEALTRHKAVVALETALVTHGLPYPSSLEVPLKLESIVRSTGSVPATIGIIGGRVKIGLSRFELERLAVRQKDPAKISRRDIGAAIALGADGGTTCSATLVFAAHAGIKVFATGGLGGVHRGGENSMDVSADLQELARCPVGLVSSGVKSILDIGRTLEYLETLGVPVASYGESREFPAFFSRHSGFNVPWNVRNPHEAARLLYTQWQLGMQNGALIAVPIPEAFEPAGQKIQEYVNQAVAESEKNGVSRLGKDATPWLLSRIAELSKGESLASNIALLENTALVGGQIAIDYQKLVAQEKSSHTFSSKTIQGPYISPQHKKPAELKPADVVVIGSAAVDITAQASPETKADLAIHSTSPGRVKLSLGGVARNIAEATHRIMEARFPQVSSVLVAPVGQDVFGQILVDQLSASNMRTDGLFRSEEPTAVCNMVLNGTGDLVSGIADMGIAASITANQAIHLLQQHTPRIVAMDGNLSQDTITGLVKHCGDRGIQTLFEPTSKTKCTSILPAITAAFQGEGLKSAPITYCTPNLLELTQLYEAAKSEPYELTTSAAWWSAIQRLNIGSAFRMDLEHLARRKLSDSAATNKTLSFLIDQGIAQKAINLLPLFQHIIIKCGDQGVLVAMCISPKDSSNSGWVTERSNPYKRYIVAHGSSNEIVVLQHFPPLPIETPVNVTGAGDSFVGALLATLTHNPDALYRPRDLMEVIYIAQKAAILTLGSPLAVSPQLSSMTNMELP